jgi:glucosamine-6-phosphate deaminase
MVLQVHKFDSAEAAGAALADRILVLLGESDPTKPFLLGCPGGRSPKPVYAALAAKARDNGVDLSRVVIVMMDEYVSVSGNASFQLPSLDAHYSCRGFGQRDILGLINAGLSSENRIPDENFWMPELNDPEAYDRKIAEAGGIDFFILASGAGDGHIAFNPPGSEANSTTRVVELARQTQTDNLKTFPDFKDISEVPSHGLTVGIGTIAKQSKEVGMILWGADKQLAYQRITQAAGYDPDWPATVAAICKSAAVYADNSAVEGP